MDVSSVSRKKKYHPTKARTTSPPTMLQVIISRLRLRSASAARSASSLNRRRSFCRARLLLMLGELGLVFIGCLGRGLSDSQHRNFTG